MLSMRHMILFSTFENFIQKYLNYLNVKITNLYTYFNF